MIRLKGTIARYEQSIKDDEAKIEAKKKDIAQRISKLKQEIADLRAAISEHY